MLNSYIKMYNGGNVVWCNEIARQWIVKHEISVTVNNLQMCHPPYWKKVHPVSLSVLLTWAFKNILFCEIIKKLQYL